MQECTVAATIFSPSRGVAVSQSQLRVAFDGDAVLFSRRVQSALKAHGLDRFFEHEKATRTSLWPRCSTHSLEPLGGIKLPEPALWLEPRGKAKPQAHPREARAPPQASALPFSHLDPWLLSSEEGRLLPLL